MGRENERERERKRERARKRDKPTPLPPQGTHHISQQRSSLHTISPSNVVASGAFLHRIPREDYEARWGVRRTLNRRNVLNTASGVFFPGFPGNIVKRAGAFCMEIISIDPSPKSPVVEDSVLAELC